MKDRRAVDCAANPSLAVNLVTGGIAGIVETAEIVAIAGIVVAIVDQRPSAFRLKPPCKRPRRPVAPACNRLQ